MKAVLTSDDDYPFLDGGAKAALAQWRDELGELLRRDIEPMQYDGDAVTWWTFAGGRINQTLKYAIEWKEGWKVVPDNFSVRVQGDGVRLETVRSVVRELSDPGFWADPQTRRKLMSVGELQNLHSVDTGIGRLHAARCHGDIDRLQGGQMEALGSRMQKGTLPASMHPDGRREQKLEPGEVRRLNEARDAMPCLRIAPRVDLAGRGSRVPEVHGGHPRSKGRLQLLCVGRVLEQVSRESEGYEKHTPMHTPTP